MNVGNQGLEVGTPGEITQCLREWREGGRGALERLTQAVYRELRRAAGALMSSETGHTLQPTALVHELYFKLPGVREFDWKSRSQFLSVAANMMRHIIVDHARSRRAAKRGSGSAVEPVFDTPFDDPGMRIDVLLVEEALGRFAAKYPRQAKVVELRFFGGLSVDEAAEVLRESGEDVSLRTVERDWTFARAWLQKAIE